MSGIAPEHADLYRAVVRWRAGQSYKKTAAMLQPQWHPAGGVMMDEVVARAALCALVFAVTPVAARVTAIEPTAISHQPNVRVIA